MNCNCNMDMNKLMNDIQCKMDDYYDWNKDYCCEPEEEDPCCEECCPRPRPKPVPVKGRIDVTIKLGCLDGEPLGGVAVELYRVDCTSGFELISCQYSDQCGKVSFICLEDGLYAVKQPLDPCYFEQPEYYPCYEVCITPCCKRKGILIINNLRPRENCNRPPICPRCSNCY